MSCRPGALSAISTERLDEWVNVQGILTKAKRLGAFPELLLRLLFFGGGGGHTTLGPFKTLDYLKLPLVTVFPRESLIIARQCACHWE